MSLPFRGCASHQGWCRRRPWVWKGCLHAWRAPVAWSGNGLELEETRFGGLTWILEQRGAVEGSGPGSWGAGV